MSRLKTIGVAVVMFGLLTTPQAAFPQILLNPPKDPAIIRVDVDLVNVLFNVRDRRGTYVNNLTRASVRHWRAMASIARVNPAKPSRGLVWRWMPGMRIPKSETGPRL